MKNDKNGKPVSISFNNLQSRPQRYLETRAPDPSCLGKEGIEKFREEFVEAFTALAEAVPDAKAMSRLMQSGVASRRRKMAKRLPRRRLVLASV